MITDKNIQDWVLKFNTAQGALKQPAPATPTTGASFVFGAMNGYLYMMKADGNYSDEQYNLVKDSFQGVVKMFSNTLDVESFTQAEPDNQDWEVIMLPKGIAND